MDVLRRGARAFLQAGMRQHVHDDMIVGRTKPCTAAKPADQPVG